MRAETEGAPFDGVTAFTALAIIDYLSDLFTLSAAEVFSKESVLVALNLVKNDPEIFTLQAMEAYEAIIRNSDD